MIALSKLSKSYLCQNIVSSWSKKGFNLSQMASYFTCLTEGTKLDCPPPVEPKPDYRIEPSRGPGDVHQLKYVLKQTFFLDEPSIKLFGLTGCEFGGELIDVMLQGVTFEESLLAIWNSTNEIIGFALNGELDLDKFSDEVERWRSQVRDPRNKKLFALWRAMNEQFNFKNVRPTARALEIFYLGVVPKARSRGLGKKLVSDSLVLAKSRGYGIVQVVCTSDKSARICKSLDMKRACAVEYDSLLMPEDGRPIVTQPPPPPSENVKIYYQTI